MADKNNGNGVADLEKVSSPDSLPSEEEIVQEFLASVGQLLPEELTMTEEEGFQLLVTLLPKLIEASGGQDKVPEDASLVDMIQVLKQLDPPSNEDFEQTLTALILQEFNDLGRIVSLRFVRSRKGVSWYRITVASPTGRDPLCWGWYQECRAQQGRLPSDISWRNRVI